MKIQGAAVSAALCFLLLAMDCTAAVLNVSPVRVEIPHRERSALITIRNEGSEPASLQADIHHWAQDEDGDDLLGDTEDLLIVPRIFTIPAGQSQVVRIGKLVEASADAEGTYRLIITELAPPEDIASGSGISVRLRLSLPVFLAPKANAEAVVSVVRSQRHDDRLEVVMTNSGNATGQILGFRLSQGNSPVVEDGPPGESTDERIQVGGYLLPGATRPFMLPLPPDADVTGVTAFTDTSDAVRYVLPGNN